MKIEQHKKRFRLIGTGTDADIDRKFASLAAMRLFTCRNREINAIPYILHNEQWERFVAIGSKAVSKTELEAMLKSIQDEPRPKEGKKKRRRVQWEKVT